MALPALAIDPTLPPLLARARQLLFGDGELIRHAADAAGGMTVNLVLAGATLAATLWASNWLSQLTARAIHKAHRRRSVDTTLQTFASSLVRYGVIIVGLVAVLERLGVKATSVIAVLGAASLAIGLALQGALANVAAGVMLLVLRPYRVGDRVIIDGKEGTVRRLDLFATRLADPDNLAVFVPNAKAFGAVIVNETSPTARRVQLDFTIDFDDDVDQALELLLACARANPQVVEKPPPWAKLTGVKDSGLQVSLRAWFATADYWDGRFDLTKAVKDSFETAGLTFPYPHQVAVESRKFTPPAAKRTAAKGRVAKTRRAVSPRPASPRPTRAGSSKGR